MDSRQWPRLRDLPPEEREPFKRWLFSYAGPVIEGLPREEQDAYYSWDYEVWKEDNWGPWL